MKRIVTTGLALILGLSLTFGQNILKEYGYTVYGGISLSSFDKGSIKTTALPGFHFGGAVEIPVTKKFSIQPGLELSLKGAKYDRTIPQDGYFKWENILDDNGNTMDLDLDGNPDQEIVVDPTKIEMQPGTTERLLYVQIPVLAYTHFELGKGKLFLAGGPYLGAGIFSYASKGDDTQKKAPFYAKQYKQLDFGAQFKAGYEFPSGYFFSVGYDYGLSDISSSVFPPHKTGNRTILFSIGRKVWGY